MHPTRRDAGYHAIDLVIPHVDGAAPGFAEAHAAALGKPPVPCQLRDNGELRFVLRSVARSAAFFRRVYLVVMDDAHVPAWVDRDQVTVVEHVDFVPAEFLPTFHTAPIWHHLHAIPGLSERFVIAADDEFFGREVAASDFFTTDGEPRLDLYAAPVFDMGPPPTSTYGVKLQATRRALFERVTASRLEQRFGHFVFPHIARGNTVSSWRAMQRAFADHDPMNRTLARRDRAKGEQARDYVLTDQLYVGWVEQTMRRRVWWQKIGRMTALQIRILGARVGLGVLPWAIYKMTNDPGHTAREMAKLLRQRPARFCINDDAYDTFEGATGEGDGVGRWEPQWQVNPASLAVLHSTLEALFPAPCRYELGSSAASGLLAAKPSAAT